MFVTFASHVSVKASCEKRRKVSLMGRRAEGSRAHVTSSLTHADAGASLRPSLFHSGFPFKVPLKLLSPLFFFQTLNFASLRCDSPES